MKESPINDIQQFRRSYVLWTCLRLLAKVHCVRSSGRRNLINTPWYEDGAVFTEVNIVGKECVIIVARLPKIYSEKFVV